MEVTPVTRDAKGAVDKIQAAWTDARRAFRTFDAEREKAFNYVVGDQLDDEVRKKLNDAGRPALIFNLMQNKVVAIGGLLEQNKSYLRAIGVGEEDQQLADMHTRLVSDWAMPNCNGMQEIAKAAIDSAIGKVGWVNNYYTTGDDPQGKWVTEHIDPRFVYWDYRSKKQDQSDWGWVSYSGMYTADEVIGVYSAELSPEQIAKIKMRDRMITGLYNEGASPVSWYERMWANFKDAFGVTSGADPNSTEYTGSMLNDYTDARAGRYRVIEWHDRRVKDVTVFYNPMTRQQVEVEDVPGEGPDERKIREQAKLQELTLSGMGAWMIHRFQRSEIWKTTVAPTLFPDEPLSEAPYQIQGRGFALKPIFCYPFHPDPLRMQSLIEVLIEPQDSYNQRRMTFLEWLMNAVNPSYVAPTQSINAEDMNAWKSGERGLIKFFKPVMGLKPEPQHPLAEASSLKVFSDEDKELSETLSGITPNTLGLQENANESGVLFARRVQQSMTALSMFFGNVHLAMQEIFKFVDRGLQVYMDMPRKIRILSNGTPEWIAVNMQTLQGVQNDVSQGEYDFVVDTNSLGESAKQVKFAEAMEFAKLLPPELVKWDSLFRLWDSPISEEMAQFAGAVMGIAADAQAREAQSKEASGELDMATKKIGAATQLAGAMQSSQVQ